MKNKHFILSLCVLLILPKMAVAGVLDIKTFETPQGIKVWLVEDKTVPVISMQFLFRGAGAVNDPQDKQGLSQLLSNTMDEGAGDIDAKSFQQELTDKSITLRFSSSRDDFGGSLKTLTKYQDQAFHLLQLALTEPRFEDDAIRRMTDANLARIKSDMTEPDWISARLTNAVLFGDHPYARNSGGTLSSLPKITAQDLKEKSSSQLARNNLIVAIAGHIDAAAAAAMVDRVFGQLPETARARQIDDVTWTGGKNVIFEKDIPQTVIQMAWPSIPMYDKEYAALEIMDYILGGAGFGSRLTETVREKNGLTYGIFSAPSEMDHANLYMISTSTRTETVGTVLDLIEQQINRIKSEPVSATELAIAKKYLIGSVPLGMTSTDRIASIMAGFQRFNLPPDYLDHREQALNAVSVQDVRAVAQRIFQPAAQDIILVGKSYGNENQGASFQPIDELPDVE